MSHYEGDILAHFRGPAKILAELSTLAEHWTPKSYGNEYVKEAVQEIIGQMKNWNITPSEEIETAELDLFSEIALVPLDCINNMVKLRPELEIAVRAGLRHSIAGGEAYYTYYSPTGSPTICAERTGGDEAGLNAFVDGGSVHCCGTSMQIPLSVTDVQGKSHTFDFNKLVNELGPGCDWFFRLEEFDYSDLEALLDEGIWQVFKLDAQGVWTLPGEELNWKEIPQKPDQTGEKHLAVVQSRVPGAELRIEQGPNGPHILDSEGGEYFLWDNITAGKWGFGVDWHFPAGGNWF